MRVRPFFWALLLGSCLGALILALFYNPHIPTLLQVHISNRNLVSHGMSDVYLQLTDPDGLPITQAQVKPSAHMTNMDMVTDQSDVTEAGNGHYLVQLHLYMAGPWAITIQTQADGFLSQQQTLFVEVT
jgi:YtkA-like